MAAWREVGKMAGNRTCESCQINTAKVFCECTGTRIYLCVHCVGDHTTVKYVNLMHQLVPADIEIPDVAIYRDRSDAFSKGSAELRQNLTRIDQCCQEVAAAYNTVIERLGQWRDYYVRELQAWKVTLSAEITEAENEVKNTLALDYVQLSSKYSSCLRYYQPGTLQLFTYQIDFSGFERLAQNAVKFQYAQESNPVPFNRPAHHRMLVRLRMDKLELFNFESGSFSPTANLARVIAFDTTSRYTLVDANRVFCCGRQTDPTTAGKDAYLVHVASGAVENLPPLGVGRMCPGLLSHQDSIFVFGNNYRCSGNLETEGKEVEMLQLVPRAWARLPDMHTGRCGFTPCEYGLNAYLCTGIIDVFNLQTLSFLPPILKVGDQKSAVVSVIIDHELIIITEMSSTLIDLRSLKEHKHQLKSNRISPVTTPVVYQGSIYWVHWGGGCYRASGSDFTVIETIATETLN